MYVDIEYIIIFFAIVELFSTGSYCINNLADLLPVAACGIPLERKLLEGARACCPHATYLMSFHNGAVSYHFDLSGFLALRVRGERYGTNGRGRYRPGSDKASVPGKSDFLTSPTCCDGRA